MKRISILILAFLSVVLTLNSTNFVGEYSKILLNDNRVKNDSAINNQIASSQTTLNGTWYWKSTTSDSNTELYLIQNGNEVSGRHCSSFMGGLKIDCVDNSADDSITLHMVSENVFEGIIKSGFSGAVISIRITLDPNEETVFLTQLSEPNEEYYLPNNVTLTLAQP